MVKYGLAALLLLGSTVTNSTSIPIRSDFYSVPEVIVSAKKARKHKTHGKLNTNITPELKLAMDTYEGPTVLITSLVRHWNCKSAHAHGKAVDYNWSEALIDYLVTSKGKEWLAAHSLMYYIEDRPGSKKLLPYKASEIHSKFVFENPHATGPHIHIQIKK